VLTQPRSSDPSRAREDDCAAQVFQESGSVSPFLAPFPLTLVSTEPARGILRPVPSHGDPNGHLGSDRVNK